MNPALAAQAGQLAAQIQFLNNQLSIVNQWINNGAVITGGNLNVFDPVTGLATAFVGVQQTIAESLQVLTTFQTILSGRIATAQAILASIP